MTMYELSMLAATSFVQSSSLQNYIQQLFNKTQKEHEECVKKYSNRTLVYTLDLSMVELRDLVTKNDSDKIENVYCLIYVLEEESIRKANSERRLSQSIIKTTFQKKSIVRSSFNEIYSKSVKKEVFQTKTLNINSLKSNENFKLEIQNINDFLVIEVFKEGNKKNINQNEKYFLRKVWRSVSESRKLRKDFIGQFKIQIKNLKDLDSDWNQLKCRHNDIQHDSRGLLKFHFVCSIDFTNESDNEKIESLASNDTTKLLKQYKYLLNQIFEFEILKQNKEYLSKMAIHFLRIFTDFYMIPSNSKILMEILELSKLFTLNKLDLKILLDQAKSLNSFELEKFSQFEQNEFESTVFGMMENFSQYYLFNLKTFPWDDESNLNLTHFLEVIDIFKYNLTLFDREKHHRLTMLLSEMLNRKVQEDVSNFIAIKVNIQDVSEKNETLLLQWMFSINKTIGLLNDLILNDQFKNNLLNNYINYTKIACVNISISLSGPVQLVLKFLSEYQQLYRCFKTNMNKSSRLSYDLYLNCRKLNKNLSKFVPERESFKLKLNHYTLWFKEKGIVTFWLDTYKIVSKNFVENALRLEDTKEIDQKNPISITSIIISDHFLTMCREWNEIEFEDHEIKYVGTATINEIIGDAFRHYLFKLKENLAQKDFFFLTKSDESLDNRLESFRKICICVNNTIYIKKKVICNLENLLNFDQIVNDLDQVYSENILNKNLKNALRNSVNQCLLDIESITRSIITQAGRILVKHIQNLIISFYSTKNHLPLLEFFDKCYQTLDKKLPDLDKQFMFCIRSHFLNVIHHLLPRKEQYKFYEDVYEKFEVLDSIFISFNLSSMIDDFNHIESGKSDILKKSLLIYIENEDKISYYMNNLQTFVNDIKKFSEPTYELILNHLNYLNNNDFYTKQTFSGSIYFKIGYEEKKDSMKITIKIDCGRIVNSEIDKFSYFIRLDLLPDSFFLEANIEKRTKLAIKQSSNKINFNQYFIVDNIPNVVSKIDGASVRLSLWSKNKYGKEKCLGECFYPIRFIENMEKMVSINEMLAVNKNLRDHNDQEFDLLEELMRRKEFDREAKNFICLRQQLKEIDSNKCENENKCIINKILEKTSILLDPRRCCNLNTKNS